MTLGTSTGMLLAVASYLDDSPSRMLLPALLAAAMSLGLWHPVRGSAPLAAFAAVVVLSAIKYSDATANHTAIDGWLPALTAGAVTLVVSGIVAEALARSLDSEQQRREHDERLIQALTPTRGSSDVVKWEYARQTISREIDRARRYSHSASLVLIGIADFGRYVDEHGAGGGEQLLLRLAATLDQLVRPTDVVAVRTGSELALLLPHTELAGALVAIDKLRVAARADPGCDFRAGVAEFPHDGVDVDELVKEAEAALTFARQSDLGVASRALLQRG